MLALCWDGRTLELDRNRPRPERRRGEALVRVRLAGICATDLQILRGYMGFTGVPGHEFVGEVVEGPEEMRGRRVVGEINFACGACDYCARALGRHCPSRRTMGIAGADGSFAEYLAIPAANLHLVPDSVPDEEAVFTEPLAAAFEILEQAPVAAGEEAVVLGDGKLGLLVAQVLARAGARVRIVGKHAAKLALARRLGLEAVALERWDRRRVERVVEATGSAAGLEAAIAAVRPRGTLVLKSTVAEPHRLRLAPLVIDEITVIGSRCGRFEPALVALEREEVAVAPLVSGRFPLADGAAAAAEAAKSTSIKVLLDCR